MSPAPMIKLTPANAHLYVGRKIVFRSRNTYVRSRIQAVSRTGKTLTIDECPDLGNNLQIVSRCVYLCE